MPSSAARSPARFRQSDYALWTLSSEGRYLSVAGEGLARAGIDPSAIVGAHIRDVHGNNLRSLQLIDHLMDGRPVRDTVEFAGRLWLVEGFPMLDRGQVIGAHGVSFLLEPDAATLAQPESVARKWVWELEDAIPGEADYHSSDRFFRREGRPGAMLTRWIPDSELLRLLAHHSRMRLISDSGPSIGPPHLRVLR